MNLPYHRRMVDAAHIVPWSVSHDDDVHNGMALCRLCHRTFDQGLLGVSTKYLVLLSGDLSRPAGFFR
jgi:putative restriction endonuclease